MTQTPPAPAGAQVRSIGSIAIPDRPADVPTNPVATAAWYDQVLAYLDRTEAELHALISKRR